MHVLLTGSTGYIGRRLLPLLVNLGHTVTCLVRDSRRFDFEDFDEAFLENVQLVEADLDQPSSLEKLPLDIDVAYYLVHAMSDTHQNFSDKEKRMACNFAEYLRHTHAKQVIYLGGISNESQLSPHLRSRQDTEKHLAASGIPLTVLRAAIIIGSGSASFEIIRDLVEKLPLMVAPKWIKSKCQPIAIRDVMSYLVEVIHRPETYNQIYDIGGADILDYKEMMQEYARVRNLKRYIFTVPVLTPKLSSHWLYFVTSVSYSLARSLVDSMRHDVVCQNTGINKLIPLKLLSYREALTKAFQKIAQNEVISSWKDTINGPIKENFLDFIQVPSYGCFTDRRAYLFDGPADKVLDNIWSIGGNRGWYYGTWMWLVRGFLDKLVGGVGLRRGRRSPNDLKPGDALDFWRVILADRQNCRLLLYAEMKLPGDAWLEFQIKKADNNYVLVQNATFRPWGLWGRLYWYSVLPFHGFIFPGMAKGLIRYQAKDIQVKQITREIA